MDTTVDVKSIGKLIHAGCKHHHCRKHANDLISESVQTPTAAPKVGEEWPPEFLHCGIWPPLQQASESESEINAPVRPKVKAMKQKAHVKVYPDNIPDIDGGGSDSESGSDDSDDDEDDDKVATPAEPLTVDSTELSDAIDTLKITTNGADKEGDQNGNEKRMTNVIHALAKAPYSVLKLVARHGNSDGSPRRGYDSSKSPRNRLFDQEVVAEAQARVEIADYLDSLIDHGDYEEGYGCVWPLEEYRRSGWAKEMVAAYPVESAEFTRDSSATYIHLHASRLADVFEEFCRPPASTVFAPSTVAGAAAAAAGASNQGAAGAGAAGQATGIGGGLAQGLINAHHHAQPTYGTLADGSGMTALPGHYLPFEEITLPPHLMPVNPEDEDDVVPDMHAAFGINRALNQNQSFGVIVPGSAAAAVAAAGGGVGGGGAAGGGALGTDGATGEASQAGAAREPVWRDLGLDALVAEAPRNAVSTVGGPGAGRRREGRRTGLLLLR
ncbi:hypothetical protein AYL99_02017 [Fonsecaea erecta]|uniref:Uncharacterized protein n=1 Tax=Fonsecaea erecta TaxID=1367422 RepID=A0A178ZSM1_9EURO|nr:hypothetical protein AYL99_02017 [Fonsecaea erecta]OAP62790.1 hypothetical protein AYL99_02017 [Fonsecaea erecta]